MIVYRSLEERVPTARALARVQALAGALPRGRPAHDAATELLIELGVLESALADALAPDADDEHALARELRHLCVLAGRLFARSRTADAANGLLESLRDGLAELSARSLPEEVTVSVPEGFAFYALYPETYHEAALAYLRDRRPGEVVAVGIRSIGTTLSAVVAGALEEAGVAVQSWTVRPRGHPFHRELRLSPGLRERLRAHAGAHFVVVDEGPGLSGSSFASVARALGELGVPDERIALFPSWTPDGSSFVSTEAQQQWRRHAKWTADFDRVVLRGGVLTGPVADRLVDLSGGLWRGHLCEAGAGPAVQTQHERRKYLLRDALPSELGFEIDGPRRTMLLKFAGLGRFGASRLERARALARAGYAPPVVGLCGGFLVTEWVPGTPVAAGDADPALADAVARYLAHLRAEFPAERTVSLERLEEMLRLNVEESLGGAWAARVDALRPARAAAERAVAVAGDGRMLAHEWIRTGTGFLKTDGVDHHDDHFFAGCQDIAWDLAAACVELDMPAAACRRLVGDYARLSGDAAVGERLPFFHAAYLAFRVGYTRMAADALDAPDDAQGMLELASGYEARLRRALSREDDRGGSWPPRRDGFHDRERDLTYAEERT